MQSAQYQAINASSKSSNLVDRKWKYLTVSTVLAFVALLGYLLVASSSASLQDCSLKMFSESGTSFAQLHKVCQEVSFAAQEQAPGPEGGEGPAQEQSGDQGGLEFNPLGNEGSQNAVPPDADFGRGPFEWNEGQCACCLYSLDGQYAKFAIKGQCKGGRCICDKGESCDTAEGPYCA